MMITRFNELKGRMADQGRKATLTDISEATGIRKATLVAISNNKLRVWRPEYIDALCAYFGVPIGDFMAAEPIDLPLALNLRPDRKGKRIGQ